MALLLLSEIDDFSIVSSNNEVESMLSHSNNEVESMLSHYFLEDGHIDPGPQTQCDSEMEFTEEVIAFEAEVNFLDSLESRRQVIKYEEEIYTEINNELFDADEFSEHGMRGQWAVQVVVINETSQQITWVFPHFHANDSHSTGYTDDLPHIFLLQRSCTNHVDLITDINAYFKLNSDINKKLCLYCNTQTALKTHHKCSVRCAEEVCQSCRRRYRTQNTNMHIHNEKNFCNSRIAPDIISEECVKCGVLLKSQFCIKKHKKCSKWNTGIRMKCCDTYIKVVRECPDRKSVEAIKYSHERDGCKNRVCYNCKEQIVHNISKPHHCKVPKVVITERLENSVAVIYLTPCNISPSECRACRLRLTDITIPENVCDMHKAQEFLKLDSISEFNSATILIEEEKVYRKFQYSSDELISSNMSSRDKLLGSNYIEKQGIRCNRPSRKRPHDERTKLVPSLKFFLGKRDNNCTVTEKAVRKLLQHTHLNIYAEQEHLLAMLYVLVSNYVKPLVILKAQKVIALVLGSVRFLDISNFMTQDVMLATYSSPHEYFPLILNVNSKLDTIDKNKIPNLDTFLSMDDSIATKLKKTEYHNTLKYWDFGRNLSSYNNYKCKLLLSAVRLFQKGSDIITSTLVKKTNLTKLSKVNIMDRKFSSFPSFLQDLFFLVAEHEEHDLYNSPKGGTYSRSSSGEYRWICYVVIAKKLQNVRHTYNTNCGQERVHNLFPDLISQNPENENGLKFWYYNGCYWHGCECKPPQLRHPSGRTMAEVREESNLKLDVFRAHLGIHDDMEVVRECDFQKFQNTSEYKEYLVNTGYVTRPRARANFRNANRGGITDCYGFHYDAIEDAKNELIHADINAAYQGQCINADLPYGDFHVVLAPVYEKGLFYDRVKQYYVYNNQEAFGFMHIKFLVPPNVKLPILPCQINKKNSDLDGQTISGVCRTCVETRNLNSCEHSEQERHFVGEYTIKEISYAVRKFKYEILEIYEANIYEHSGKVARTFFQVLHYLKVINSGFPNKNMTLEEKQRYCHNLNLDGDFGKELFIRVEDIKLDLFFTKNLKIFILTLIGKWAQNCFDRRTFYSDKPDILQQIVKNKKLLNVSFPTPDIALITKYVKSVAQPRMSSPPLFSYITANNRLYLIDMILELEKLGCHIKYVDTDAIIFTWPKGKPHEFLPFQIGDLIGQWKYETKNITKFNALGPKKYQLEYKDEDGNICMTTKCGGFTLNPHIVKESGLTSDTYQDMLGDFLHNIETVLPIPQNRKLRNPSLLSYKLTRKWNVHYLSNSNYLKRKIVLDSNDNFISLPYGYENVIVDID